MLVMTAGLMANNLTTDNPLQKVMDQSPISGRPARNRSILRLVRFTIAPELMTLVMTRFTHLALVARDDTVLFIRSTWRLGCTLLKVILKLLVLLYYLGVSQ